MHRIVVMCFSHLGTSADNDACRRVATLNFRGFSFLGFASEAIACHRFCDCLPCHSFRAAKTCA